MATGTNMPKAKSKSKHADTDLGEAVAFQNNKSPAFNTRSAQKDKLIRRCRNVNKSRLKREQEDHTNFYRLLQLFPYFPPVYLQRVYAECNKNFLRTIDNILYVKRYCSYLNKKRTDLDLISPKDSISNELSVIDSSDTIQSCSISERSKGTLEQLENHSNENQNTRILSNVEEWLNRKCKTPELVAPKYTSTPH